MLRWLADENFNNDILRALFRGKPGIDVVRAQDVGLTGIGDEGLLAWAAEQDRVLLTHDVSTLTAHAYRRVMRGEAMPGVFEVSCDAWMRAIIAYCLGMLYAKFICSTMRSPLNSAGSGGNGTEALMPATAAPGRKT